MINPTRLRPRKIQGLLRRSKGDIWITRERDFPIRMRMDFGLLRLGKGESHRITGRAESVAVLLQGQARARWADEEVTVSRRSVFDSGPWTLSAGREQNATIEAVSECEWAIVRTTNSTAQGIRLYRPGDCRAEDRGKGLAQGACRRLVRTIFDFEARPDSAFVIGEVVNLPGRWSSYPPHHHPQPEIYHYRFTEPQGYGHAEIGDDVHRVVSGDTTVIPSGLDHAQVSAPGYGMYYLWIVRHLPNDPYRGFTPTPAHEWMLNPERQGWKPSRRLFR